MELGEKIKQARLEAGLSQRQLCGDTITRNMLSLIENGAARPSMDTLCFLAAQLGKPVSFFLEDAPMVSPNQALILQARQAEPAEALKLLQQYAAPDALLDPEYYLLTAIHALSLAEAALQDGRPGLAATYLAQAEKAGKRSIYYTPSLEQQRLLLCRRAGTQPAPELAASLPDITEVLLLQAESALESDRPDRSIALLEAIENRTLRWHLLRGEAAFRQKAFAEAIPYYQAAEEAFPAKVYPRLEQCYRLLEDYKLAYEYACKQRP